MLQHLRDQGFAVVRSVADASELAHAEALLWEFLEGRTDMLRGEPSTWTNSNFQSVGDPTNGILSGNGFGHAEVCWFTRTLPKVRATFARIWGTERLICSFDGGNAFRPFHAPGAARHRTMGGWWHVDQGRSKRGLHAVQGLVLLTDANAHTGGLCVVPGSHKAHDELMRYTVTSPDGMDFVVVPSPLTNPMVRGGALVAAQAGDLLLWDSRTVHCNTPALAPPSAATGQPVDALLRACIYVCMTPRRFASCATLALRRRAALVGVGSSHWPHDFRPTADPRCFDSIDEAALDEADRGERMTMSRARRELIG